MKRTRSFYSKLKPPTSISVLLSFFFRSNFHRSFDFETPQCSWKREEAREGRGREIDEVGVLQLRREPRQDEMWEGAADMPEVREERAHREVLLMIRRTG
jgi:hypothetical protein